MNLWQIHPGTWIVQSNRGSKVFYSEYAAYRYFMKYGT